MTNRFFSLACPVLLLGMFMQHPSASAQKTQADPSGYILTYNKNFEGIGPQVYVLPAPRTKIEELTDIYKEISPFRDSINKAIRYQKFIINLKPTSNSESINGIIASISEKEWNSLAQQYASKKDYPTAYGILNEHAKAKAVNGETIKGIELLKAAIHLATEGGEPHDVSILQANLSTLELLNLNAAEASIHEEAFYTQALKEKSIVDQAESLVKTAQILALDKDYDAAENTIIRKAIPLFNRSKYYAGKIWAWEMLADIYQMQNKHTEAQWFLIQARDLAKAKDIILAQAEIEYMLAHSKFIQKNYNVAKAEFINAYKLAENENNSLLKLAIVEKLGNIYLLQKNVEQADRLLAEYWKLRTDLF